MKFLLTLMSEEVFCRNLLDKWGRNVRHMK